MRITIVLRMSVERALANIKDSIFVNGTWIKPAKTFDVYSGATGKIFSTCPNASVDDVDTAVKAASTAFKSWSKTSATERSDWLNKLADELEKRKDDIASVEALNTSKPFREAQGDVDDAVAAFRYCGRQAVALDTRLSQPSEALPAAEFAGKIRYEPVGVVGAICPWNFPLMMAAWKVGPSLAAGCTVVLKPSEFTPFTALCLAVVADTVKLPPGVLNVVTGAGDVGSALCTHPLTDKVSFTGSVPTGSKVMKACADGIKRVTLELGGKSPVIVFSDADIDAAIEWIFFGFAWNCGQICSATTRLIVQKDIADNVVKRLAAAANKVKIGSSFDEGVECGPIGNKMQYDKVCAYLEKSKAEGLVPVCGGGRPTNLPTQYDNGYFIAPTIFTNVTPAHTIFREEVFGPVLAVSTFETEQEAIELANNTEFGLAAGIFSTDETKAERVAAEVRAGTVWINNAQPSPHAMPWGGFKKSGIGREMGPYALLPFLEAKSITTWDRKAKLGWYPESHFTI